MRWRKWLDLKANKYRRIVDAGLPRAARDRLETTVGDPAMLAPSDLLVADRRIDRPRLREFRVGTR